MSRFEQLCVVRSLEGVYLRVLADRGQLNAGASIFRLRIESDPPRELTFSADGAGAIALALAGVLRPKVPALVVEDYSGPEHATAVDVPACSKCKSAAAVEAGNTIDVWCCLVGSGGCGAVFRVRSAVPTT